MKILGAKFAGGGTRRGYSSRTVVLIRKKHALSLAHWKRRRLITISTKTTRNSSSPTSNMTMSRSCDASKMGSKCARICLALLLRIPRASWWVPYEIGSANGRGRGCAHLIDREVNKLPSYIRAARVLTNRADLRKWLPSELSGTAGATSTILELSRKLASELDYPAFIPTNRSLADLKFY
jgi:hypothetical protein